MITKETVEHANLLSASLFGRAETYPVYTQAGDDEATRRFATNVSAAHGLTAVLDRLGIPRSQVLSAVFTASGKDSLWLVKVQP